MDTRTFVAFAFFAVVSSTRAEPTPATLEDLRGAVHLGNCSAVVVELGRGDDESAAILSAGHCPAAPYQVPAGKAFALDRPDLGRVSGFPEGSSLERPAAIEIARLAYATMTKVDLALFDARKTVAAFRDSGFRSYRLAEKLPAPGTILRVTSALHRRTQECRVERILESNREEREIDPDSLHGFEFRNSILFDSNCIVVPGWSGSPIVDESTGEIYGIVSRRIIRHELLPGRHPSKFLTLDFFMSGEGTLIGSNVVDLGACLGPDGTLRFDRNCDLPRIDPNEGPNRERPSPRRPTPEKPRERSSRWPSR